MTLKNFSWNRKGKTAALMRENLKRRLWLLSLLSFIFLCAYPLTTALMLNRYNTQESEMLYRQVNVVGRMGICNAFTIFLLTVGAVLCAIQGFSWLFSGKKVDMYTSQPVSAKKRFLVIYGNGILLYFVPFMISVLLGALVAAGMGAASPALFAELPFTLLAGLIYFLAVYHVALLACMLTGTRGMAVFFTCVFLGYDIVSWVVLNEYHSLYFSTYVSSSAVPELFSPVFRMIALLDKVITDTDIKAVTAAGIWKNQVLPMLPGLAVLLAEAVVLGVLVYICYKKRPMESGGRAIAFPAAGGVVKAFLIPLAGLFVSCCFCAISDGHDFAVAAAGLLLGILVCQVIMEILYESDLRAFSRHKKSFAAGAAAAVLCHLFFVFDISGFDTWIPSAKQVESAAVEIDFDNRYRFEYVDESYDVTWGDYAQEHMEITDVGGVLSLAKDGMGKDAPEQTPEKQLRCTVKYRMKSGREKERSFFIDYEKEQTVLNILFANEEYKRGENQVLEERMDTLFGKSEVYYNNGLQDEKVPDLNGLPLMRAYQEDIRNMSFTDIMDECPCGILELHYNTSDGIPYILEYPVLPCYTETMEYLREKDIEPYLHMDAAAVDRVEIISDREVITERTGAFEHVSTLVESVETKTKEYGKRAEIEELLPALYPLNLASWAYISHLQDTKTDVRVTPSGRSEAYLYNWNNTEFVLLPEKIPAFVAEDFGWNQETQQNME